MMSLLLTRVFLMKKSEVLSRNARKQLIFECIYLLITNFSLILLYSLL